LRPAARALLARAASAWVLATVACDGSGRDCRFGSDHAVYRSASAELDDVALVTQRGAPLALFSDASGLYARELTEHGLPRARINRLAERCDAGLAAAVSGESVWLACSRRAAASDAHGEVVLYELGAALQERGRFAPVGPQSHGVSVVAHAGALSVAWQDAAVGGARIWYASSARPEPVPLSDPAWFASAPGLFSTQGRLLALYAESQERGRSFDSRLRLLDGVGTRTPHTVAQANDGAPSPDLVAAPDGLWLAFRDRRKGRRKTGLYLSRLTTQGRQVGGAVRVGRADGVGRPRLYSCLGGLVAATPRTFAGDYFVGVVHVDRALGQPSLEQQFYEDSREFAQVAAGCLGARMLLLIAERGRPEGGRAALRSVGFSCD